MIIYRTPQNSLVEETEKNTYKQNSTNVCWTKLSWIINKRIFKTFINSRMIPFGWNFQMSTKIWMGAWEVKQRDDVMWWWWSLWRGSNQQDQHEIWGQHAEDIISRITSFINFLKLQTVDMLDQIILCYAGLFYLLYNVSQHAWPLSFTCQWHLPAVFKYW